MSSISYGAPLQYGVTQTTSSSANTTRSPDASSASTVVHSTHPPAKRAKARSSSRISPGTNGSPRIWAWGWASEAPASRPWLTMTCVYRTSGSAACSARRRWSTFISSSACSSSSWSSPPRCSGVYTNTSWIPLASAATCTGPRWWTTNPESPRNAGYRLGMTRIFQLPPSSTVSNAGSVASSWPGQNGHGRPGMVSMSTVRGAKSDGRSARSATIVTHRPVSGLRRI